MDSVTYDQLPEGGDHPLHWVVVGLFVIVFAMHLGVFFLVDLNCDKRKLRCNMAFYVFLVSMHNIQ